MQSLDDLSEEAKIGYQAFIDMSNSKAAHFHCLQAIEAIYDSGGVPGITENIELQRLLANHDKNVLAFTTAMAAVTDKDEKIALVQLMS
jgi:hypothetical protein